MVSMLKSWTLQFWISSLWWGVLYAQIIQNGDAQGLFILKSTFKDLDPAIAASWQPLDNQNSRPDCKALLGVTCDQNGRVISIDLPRKMTSGVLNDLQNLQNVQTVNLQGNGLTGKLKGWSANELISLDLSENAFDGVVEFNINKLQILYLQGNKLTSLPEGILPSLNALQRCDLSRNLFTGRLASNLPGTLTYLNVSNQAPGGGFEGLLTDKYCPLIQGGNFFYDGNTKLRGPDACPLGALPPAGTPAGMPPVVVPPVTPAPPGTPVFPPPSIILSPPPGLPSPPPPCGVCTANQLSSPGSCDCINPVFANMTIAMDYGRFPSVQDNFLSEVARVCNVTVTTQVRLLSTKPGSVLASLAILPPPPDTKFDKATADRITLALQAQTLNMTAPIGAVLVTQVTPPAVTLDPPGAEPEETKKGGISVGIIAGVAVGAVALIAIIIVLFCCCCGRNKGHRESKLISEPSLSYTDQIRPVKKEKVIKKKPKVTDPVVIEKAQKKSPKSALVTNRVFTFKELQNATNYFGRENLIGEGALGRVYKAEFPNGQLLAVKKLDNMSAEKEGDFMTVVNAVGRLRQDNLVELEGYCAEPGQHALAYQFVANGSLFDHLHAAESGQMLMWNHRVRIALGAARALEYLHESVSPPVVHRNFKSANVLLDDEYTPKVADSGLAALGGGPGEKVSTQMLGTFGYAAPEYAMTGQHTAKSDVYSFGVVCLELLTGRRPLDSSRPRMEQSLVRWAVPQLQDVDALAKMADPKLLHHYPIKSLARFADIIALCVQPEPEFRPPMSEVVQALVRLQQRNTKVTKSGDGESNTPPAYFSGGYGANGDNFV